MCNWGTFILVMNNAYLIEIMGSYYQPLADNEILADKQSQQNKAEFPESDCPRLLRLLHLDRAQPSCQDVVLAVKNHWYVHVCMCTILTTVKNLQHLVHIMCLLPDFHVRRRRWWSYRQRCCRTDDRSRVCVSATWVRFQLCLRRQKLDIQSAKSKNPAISMATDVGDF